MVPTKKNSPFFQPSLYHNAVYSSTGYIFFSSISHLAVNLVQTTLSNVRNYSYFLELYKTFVIFEEMKTEGARAFVSLSPNLFP